MGPDAVARARDAAPTLSRSFPLDAHAIIYQPARSAMTSGKRGPHEWNLRFEPRSAPYIEPLMGWTASDDTLQQIELSFPTAEAAVAYARPRGISYTVQGWIPPAPELAVVPASTDEERLEARARRRRLEWVERTLGPDLLQHGIKPASASMPGRPRDILDDAGLSVDQKRDILLRWAHDSYLVERSHVHDELADGSRLGEVMDALLDLEETQSKMPIGHSSYHARAA